VIFLSTKGCTIYIVQANRKEPAYLAVIDHDNEEYHRFQLGLHNVSRLVAECGSILHDAVSSFDSKQAAQDIVAELSKTWANRAGE